MKTIKEGCKGKHHQSHKGKKGPSSFFMQDPNLVFNELNLKKGEFFLDLGCGTGDYSLEASKYIGDTGIIYAMDLNSHSVDILNQEIIFQRIKNIKTSVADVAKPLPLENDSINTCFISTVLHAMDLSHSGHSFISQIQRVLKENGKLSIIECHKRKADFGPPEKFRISPEEIEEMVSPFGFRKRSIIDLGHNYLIQFYTGMEAMQ